MDWDIFQPIFISVLFLISLFTFVQNKKLHQKFRKKLIISMILKPEICCLEAKKYQTVGLR